jgi:hypothetical protein
MNAAKRPLQQDFYMLMQLFGVSVDETRGWEIIILKHI